MASGSRAHRHLPPPAIYTAQKMVPNCCTGNNPPPPPCLVTSRIQRGIHTHTHVDTYRSYVLTPVNVHLNFPHPSRIKTLQGHACQPAQHEDKLTWVRNLLSLIDRESPSSDLTWGTSQIADTDVLSRGREDLYMVCTGANLQVTHICQVLHFMFVTVLCRSSLEVNAPGHKPYHFCGFAHLDTCAF